MREEFAYEFPDSPSPISKDSVVSRKIVGCLFASNCNLEGSVLTIDELLDRDSSPHVIKCGNEQDDYQYYATLNEAGNGLGNPTVYFHKVAGINAKYPIIYKYITKYYTNHFHYQGGLENYGMNWLYGENRDKFPIFNYTDFIQGKMPECKRIR